MPALSALARVSGSFAMVAADQRESLRTMLRDATGDAADDGRLAATKVAIAERLSPYASALLLDTAYGVDPVLAAGALDRSCGLIVAADTLVQDSGGPVLDTDLDPAVDAGEVAARGAAALKLLVIWRGATTRDRLERLAAAFVAGARCAGLLSVLEALVRAPEDADASGWDREAEAVEAARAFGAIGPDLYKAEVPLLGRGTAAEVTRGAERITGAVGGPWVVLSNGVRLEDFPAAVEAACLGGASGFLAGRAIWSDALGAADLSAALDRVAVPRLVALGETVDRVARPWTEARRA